MAKRTQAPKRPAWAKLSAFFATHCILLLFMIVPSPSFAQTDIVYPGEFAEYAYRIDYAGRKKHKAFAIGPYGSYGYSWDYPTAKKAAAAALIDCERTAKNWLAAANVPGKCRVLAAGDKLAVSNPWIGPRWQEPSTGEDLPLKRGVTRFTRRSPAKGVVLALHGCDGIVWDEYPKILGDYFDALGFDFVFPDSFAEPRPSAICGRSLPAAWRTKAEITKLRIAQTQRTLAELKLKYGDQPIYVWGHSEGSVVARMLQTKVAGIIASGDECDVSGLRIAADASVPVLFMFGENDPFVQGATMPLTETKMGKCRNFVRNKNTKIVIIKNNKHHIYPWRPEVATAISSFFGANPIKLPEEQEARVIELSVWQRDSKGRYDNSLGHRAFSVSADGAVGWSSNWEFAEDAKNYSLYYCARAAGKNMFKLASQHCILQDLDGMKSTAN